MSEQLSRKTIWGHVKSIQTCMMVTHGESDIRARPMRGIPRPEQNEIWFFTDRDTHDDTGLRANPRACLTFVDSKDNVFVSLSGHVSRVSDKVTILELWNEEAGSYFSEGPDDRSVVLLRFEPHSGEYWMAPSSPIVIAIKFLEAKILGERPSLGTGGRARLP
jgi:general stress protein 26